MILYVLLQRFAITYTGPAEIRFDQATYAVAEGGSVDVCVELVFPAGATSLGCNISVTLSSTDGPLAGLLGFIVEFYNFVDLTDPHLCVLTKVA